MIDQQLPVTKTTDFSNTSWGGALPSSGQVGMSSVKSYSIIVIVMNY